jgi:hypothetical protein
MHVGQFSLAEMLTYVPKVDQDQFQESGDGNVNILLYILGKYMLPSLRIQGYMHDKSIEDLAPRRSRRFNGIIVLLSGINNA